MPFTWFGKKKKKKKLRVSGVSMYSCHPIHTNTHHLFGEANTLYTCHWYAQATFAAPLGQSQTMSCVYLLRASHIHA